MPNDQHPLMIKRIADDRRPAKLGVRITAMSEKRQPEEAGHAVSDGREAPAGNDHK